MILVSARIPLLVFALAAMFASLPVHAAQSTSPQTAPPATQSPPPAKPKKKPAEPIDPDTSAGVRGPGSPLTIRVMFKGKTVEGAHVVVKNANGSLAASCDTASTGDCKVDVGADKYMLSATTKGRAGTVSLAVTESTGPVVIRIAKVKTPSTAPQP